MAGGQMGQIVCACVRIYVFVCTCARCSRSEWKGMMESLKHAVTERRGERRGGLKEAHWVVLAKVKNHAMVQWGPVTSTGRSDYIYAGTQVLLNTLSFVLPRPSLPPSFCNPLSSSLSPSVSPGPVQVQMAICCTTPTTCLHLLGLVPNSM